MSMNDMLARAYGTNGAGYESDVEKTAQALLLNKFAQDENIDLSGLTEDQLALLAQEVAAQVASQQGQGAPGGQPGGMPGMGAPGGMPGMGAPGPQMGGMPGGMPGKPAGGGPAQANIQPAGGAPQGGAPAPGPGGAPEGGEFSEEQVKVAQAKMAEADFLGRMMAHALVQEMGRIKVAQEGGGSPFGMPPQGSTPPNPPPFGGGNGEKKDEDKDKKDDEEEEAEKTAMAFLAARGYSFAKTASSEGPLTRAIRALGGSVK